MGGRRAGERVNSIRAGAQKDLGSSGVSGRPLPRPSHPLHATGERLRHQTALRASLPFSLRSPVIFPSYPSFQSRGWGFPLSSLHGVGAAPAPRTPPSAWPGLSSPPGSTFIL